MLPALCVEGLTGAGRARRNKMSGTQDELRPDPMKLFMVRWGFGVVYLAIIFSALYFLRAIIPQIPEPFPITVIVSCLYGLLSLTRGTINHEIAKDVYDRAPAFDDVNIWSLISLILMVILIILAGVLIYLSWKWFAFVFVLSNALFFSRYARSISYVFILPVFCILSSRSR